MSFRKRDRPARDAGTVDDPPGSPLALAEAAEAEAAQVEAQALAARARAQQLRRQAGTALQREDSGDPSADPAGNRTAVEEPAVHRPTPRRWRMRRPTSTTLVVGMAAVLTCLSLATSGYFVWQDRCAAHKHRRATEFTDAARRDVSALMALDFTKTKDDMQHIADNATGRFKEHFPLIADQLIKSLQRSQLVTTVTINDAAVESMTDKSAVVLVAATTEAKEPDGASDPRTWHVVVDLVNDGGQPKLANVEFIQ